MRINLSGFAEFILFKLASPSLKKTPIDQYIQNNIENTFINQAIAYTLVIDAKVVFLVPCVCIM